MKLKIYTEGQYQVSTGKMLANIRPYETLGFDYEDILFSSISSGTIVNVVMKSSRLYMWQLVRHSSGPNAGLYSINFMDLGKLK